MERRRDRRSKLTSRNNKLAGEHSAVNADRGTAAQRMAGLADRLARLTAIPRLRDLAEAAPDDSVDLWAEASVLVRRLSDAVMAADEERILKSRLGAWHSRRSRISRL